MADDGVDGVDGVDEVELKVTVQKDAVQEAEDALDLRPDDAERRWIWFCESPDGASGRPPLLSRGVILRLRAGRRTTTATLKLRGTQGCLDVPAWTARTAAWDDAKVEGDWSGSRRMVSASVDADTTTVGAPEAAAVTPLDERLSDEQRALIGEWFVPLGRLHPLGPIAVTKWEKRELPGRDEELVAERWVVDDLRFLEFSIRVPAAHAESVQDRLRAHLQEHGIHEHPEAPTKTETVVNHLTGGR